MFFLELNHDTLTTRYQIPHYRFAYMAESPVLYLKLGGLFSKKYIINQLLIADKMEGKLSIGLLSPSSISFNDNSIVRNFYPKKLYSSKRFKDLPST